ASPMDEEADSARQKRSFAATSSQISPWSEERRPESRSDAETRSIFFARALARHLGHAREPALERLIQQQVARRGVPGGDERKHGEVAIRLRRAELQRGWRCL